MGQPLQTIVDAPQECRFAVGATGAYMVRIVATDNRSAKTYKVIVSKPLH